MQAIRSRDTKPEMAVRRLLHAQGYRYRVHYAPVPGVRRRADIVFTRARVAVFIDGCFWHDCPDHGHAVEANADYWSPKLRRTVERDRETNEVLGAAGWLVLRFWEHSSAPGVARAVAVAVDERVSLRK